jgi:hypothetical protein
VADEGFGPDLSLDIVIAAYFPLSALSEGGVTTEIAIGSGLAGGESKKDPAGHYV